MPVNGLAYDSQLACVSCELVQTSTQMRLGSVKWHIEVSRDIIIVRSPLRPKLTFWFGAVAMIGIVIMAPLCIAQSLRFTQRLMRERLAQFASMRANQIERDLTDQVSLLNLALSGETITRNIQGLYYENVTMHDWAMKTGDIMREMFLTSLRTYQVLFLYDVSGSLVFGMANPELPQALLSGLAPSLPDLLPIGGALVDLNSTSIRNSTNQTEKIPIGLAGNSKPLSLGGTVDGSGHTTSNATQVLWTAKDNLTSTHRHVSLNFSRTVDNITAYLSRPVPLVNDSGVIDAYSYSLSIPVSYDQIKETTQVSQLVGYCTAVLDCSHYMNYTGLDDLITAGEMDEMRDPWISIVSADHRGWKYLFPTGTNTTVDKSVHLFSEFPAVQADRAMMHRLRGISSSHKPGGALVSTSNPIYKKASIGFSYVRAVSQDWYVLVSVPRYQAESSYTRQTSRLIGLAVGIIMLIILWAFFISGFVTHPIAHIYRGMALQSSRGREPRSESRESDGDDERQNITAVVGKEEHLNQTYNSDTDSAVIHKDTNVVLPTLSSSGENPDGFSNNDHDTAYIATPIAPLNRWWITDEFDELVSVYNKLCEQLQAQYAKMEYEVRLRTQEARESQRLAEEANAAKSKFLMNVSHELRTPMNGILGMALVTMEETDKTKIRKDLLTIIESSESLAELLSELLGYSTSLAGSEGKLQNFSIRELLAHLKTTSKARADKKGVKVHFSTYPAELMDGSLLGDIEAIRHIGISLISNAIKFMRPANDGAGDMRVICVRAGLKNLSKVSAYTGSKKMVGPKEQLVSLELVIQDKGIGIPKDRLAHIFEAFVQGEDALSKRFTGTGIGLAMSKLLCDRIGGKITVYSKINCGTTAVLEVPVCMSTVASLDVTSMPYVEDETWRTDSRRGGSVYWQAKTSESKKTAQGMVGETPNVKIQIKSETIDTDSTHSKDMPGHSTIFDKDASSNSLQRPSSVVSAPMPPTKLSSETYTPRLSGGTETRASSMAQLRVLVADDNEILRQLLHRMLGSEGIGHVDVAKDGPSVVRHVEDAIVAGTRYSIIFMDLSMPGVDGIQATQDIRRQLGYFCPIVALTGFSDEGTFTRCLEAGIQMVLTKPVNQAQLIRAIDELVIRSA